MIYKKSITVLVPSELLYAFDPDHEQEFVLSRERGLIVARPVVEVAAGMTPCEKGCCCACQGYDSEFDCCGCNNT